MRAKRNQAKLLLRGLFGFTGLRFNLFHPRRCRGAASQLQRAVMDTLEMRILFGGGIANPGVPDLPNVPCGCSTDPVLAGDGPMPALPPGHSLAPVRFIDGMPSYNSTDLVSNAFGSQWGIVRSWTGVNDTGQIGNGWMIGGLPYLELMQNQVPDGHGAIVGVVHGGVANWFDSSDSTNTFTARDNNQMTLTYTNPTTLGLVRVPGKFTLKDAAGDIFTFNDLPRIIDSQATGTLTAFGRLFGGSGYTLEATNQFNGTYTTAATYRFGALTSMTDPGGNITTVAYDSSGNLTDMTRVDPSDAHGEEVRFDFTYSTLGNSATTASAALITQISMQQRPNDTASWTTVQYAVYDYYLGDNAWGRFGDLEHVAIHDEQSGSDIITNEKYYRYNKFWGTTYTGPLTGFGQTGPTNDPTTSGGTDTTYSRLSSSDIPNGGTASDTVLFRACYELLPGSTILVG